MAAFRIDARPALISVWPQVRRLNGTALFRNPMTRNGAQPARVDGMERPDRRTTTHNVSAASATRTSTMVSGGSSRTETPAKKNAPPQMMASTISIVHSIAPMRGP